MSVLFTVSIHQTYWINLIRNTLNYKVQLMGLLSLPVVYLADGLDTIPVSNLSNRRYQLYVSLSFSQIFSNRVTQRFLVLVIGGCAITDFYPSNSLAPRCGLCIILPDIQCTVFYCLTRSQCSIFSLLLFTVFTIISCRRALILSAFCHYLTLIIFINVKIY